MRSVIKGTMDKASDSLADKLKQHATGRLGCDQGSEGKRKIVDV